MSASQQGYAPEEFVAKLKAGGLDAPLAFVGMAKEAQDDQHLLFASGTACEQWIEVPLALVERVELGGMVPCRDHSHPLVKLELKEPESEEARLFAALARSRAGSAPAIAGAGPKLPPALRRGGGAGLGAFAAPAAATHSRESCLGCFRFWASVIPNPDIDDFVFTLNFCESLCE
jgi:hypothetical protein